MAKISISKCVYAHCKSGSNKAAENNSAKKQKKPAKDRTEFKPGKPKDSNAAKKAKPPKKLTPEQEAKERQTLKDNAASVARVSLPPSHGTSEF